MKIIVEKSKRKLMVLENEIVVKEFKIALGKYPIGKKQFEGDEKTPEGNYIIDGKSLSSNYYKNLRIVLNWTDGCIAVTNKKMDYLYKNIPIGTEIIINP